MYQFLDLLSKNIELLALLISAISVLISAFACILTLFNLREMKIARIEESKGSPVIYFYKVPQAPLHEIILKNFGKSSTIVKSVSISPPLDDNKAKESFSHIRKSFFYENTPIFLAPNQLIHTTFDFRQYPDKVFNITITYETLGRSYTDSYHISNEHRDDMISLHPKKDDFSTTQFALCELNKSIEKLSERLR